MTAIIQFENVHNQQDKGAANDEKRLKAWGRGREEEGQVLSW